MIKVKEKDKLLVVAMIGLSVFSSMSSCKKDNKESEKPKLQVQLKDDAALGKVLVDADGSTLYFFANDATTANTCTGGCEVLWPVFNATLTTETVGAGLSIADFTTITTASAKKQLAYKGRPLYYYAPVVNGVNTRESAGQTKGEGVGGVWYVAKPDYSILLSNAQLVGADGKNYLSDKTEGNGKTIFFTDSKGATLYIFAKDKQNTNTYTKADFSNNGIWPIYETEKVVVPSTLDKSLFASITVFGKKQLTYKGWPLYFFGQDNGTMGSTKGVSVPAPGVWPVGRKEIPVATP